MTEATDKLVNVGALKGPHGLKGQLKAKITLDDPDLLVQAGPLLMEDGTPLTVTHWATAGQGLIALTVKGVDSVGAAIRLRGFVFLERAKFPAQDGEIYLDQLLGLPVLGLDGVPIGHIKTIIDLPAGPALEVERDGAKPLLVPAQPEFVTLDEPVTLTELGMALLAL
jgi:16S rRNA processing protein RimM